jgi:parallel beta-helix repeat protein
MGSRDGATIRTDTQQVAAMHAMKVPSPLLRVLLAGLLGTTSGTAGGPGRRPTGLPGQGCVPAPRSTLVVSVRDGRMGAQGDGITDDTQAIQRAVDVVAGTGGTVSIPKGTYLVNALVSVRLRSDMALALAPGAVLKAIPNSSAHSAILLVSKAERVSITGGTLLGERAGHTGQGGEWGHGLSLAQTRQVVVAGVTARECWGDGFYVSSSSEVTFCGVVADHNRRQGMSITSGKGIVVRDSTFKNTAGTLPEDGLDIEPNAGDTVDNVLIMGCKFLDNAGFGLEIGVPHAHTGRAWVSRVVVDGNTSTGNGAHTLSTSPRAGIEVANCAGVQVTNNRVAKNGLGILLRGGADHCTVTGNSVAGNAGDGIVQYLCKGNTISGNTVTGNRGRGINSSESSVEGVTRNTLSGNERQR